MNRNMRRLRSSVKKRSCFCDVHHWKITEYDEWKETGYNYVCLNCGRKWKDYIVDKKKGVR